MNSVFNVIVFIQRLKRSIYCLSLCYSFSEVLVDQLTRSRTVTLGADLPLQRGVSYPPPVVLLVKRQQSSLLSLQVGKFVLSVFHLGDTHTLLCVAALCMLSMRCPCL